MKKSENTNKSSGLVAIEAKNLEYSFGHKHVLIPLDFRLEEGKTLVITGPSGSGKTTLTDIISGERKPSRGEIFVLFRDRLEYVKQQDNFIAEAGIRISYYSQRYENPNQEDVPSVLEYLAGKIPGAATGQLRPVLRKLEMENLKDRKILSLSNGERKRLQLASSIARSPEILVLDQPFTGLDPRARETLTRILEKLKKEGTTLVIVADEEHIPPFADVVLELKLPCNFTPKVLLENTFDRLQIPDSTEVVELESVVQMKNVHVVHGGNAVLTDIDWEIRKGEKWLLRGPNGAGKSTLLSLISADHPQAYSNDLVLFSRRRGSGESIWDIKKKIGFVSPELHLYFLRHRGIYKPSAGSELRYNAATCLDVVLSGYKDEVGFSTSRQKMQVDRAREWLHAMNLDHLEKAVFSHCSLGEQRNILLARALIKTPELLILDEPCQGLDPWQVKQFLKMLDGNCARNHTTLVYVTHRLEEIPACVTHFLELDNGRMKAKGKFDRQELAL